MTELVMVGTVHAGKKYKKKLRNLLKKEKPDVICTELGGLKVMKQLVKENKKIIKGFRNKVKNIIKEEYEWPYKKVMKEFSVVGYDMLTEPLRYTRWRKKPIYFIDSKKSNIAIIKDIIKKIKYEEEEFIGEALEMIKFVMSKEAIVGLINLIKKGGDELKEVIGTIEKEMYIGPRDEVMKKRLKRIIKEHEGKKIMTINGALHLGDDPKNRTLYSKVMKDPELRALKPRRIFLN